MPLTLDLSPELEAKLRNEAAKAGISADDLAVSALEARFGMNAVPDHLSPEESRLFQKINLGFPAEFWNRYREIAAKCEGETLSADEKRELIAHSDQIENANVERLKHLVELARHRGTTLQILMNS